jgi:N-acetylglucosamine-6-phosphate deacetylase
MSPPAGGRQSRATAGAWTGTWEGRDPAGGLVAVSCADGRVTSVVRRPDPSAATVGGAAGGDAPYLIPGLVDLQVNGYAGLDLNARELEVETVVELVHALARTGVTGFAPTLVTAPADDLRHAAAVVAAAVTRSAEVAAAVAFLHVEGPHLSPEDGYRGAHPLGEIRPPDPVEFDALAGAAHGLLGLVTVSPHYPQAPAYIRHAVANGVRVAIGHTHARAPEIAAAVTAGAAFSTHLGNGCAALLPRHDNHLWPQLADPRLTAGFIADGFHLTDEALAAMLAAKGEQSYLVSDAVALAGSPPGEYDSPIGGRVTLSPEGRLSMAGSTMLAGAACGLSRGVATLARLDGGSVARGVALAAERPRRIAGWPAAFTVGAPADLVLVDHQPGDLDLEVLAVVSGGRLVLG